MILEEDKDKEKDSVKEFNLAEEIFFGVVITFMFLLFVHYIFRFSKLLEELEHLHITI